MAPRKKWLYQTSRTLKSGKTIKVKAHLHTFGVRKKRKK